MLATPHDLLQPLPFLISQPPRPHRLSHHASRHSTCQHKIECGSINAACQPSR
jgi:hypothetical protein